MTNPQLEFQLRALIETSIIERYDGDLELREDPREGEYTYTPRDTGAIRELLNMLWGEHVSVLTIERVFKTLVKDGALEWPHAYCDDDEDANLQRLATLDQEIECAESHLATLKQEQGELNSALPPRVFAKRWAD